MDAPRELRVVITVDDFSKALAFYRDGLGLAVKKEWARDDGRGIVLTIPKATLELVDTAQAETIDAIEVGRRIPGPVRLALEVTDIREAVRDGTASGVVTEHLPVETPWGHRSVRMRGPGGLQLTFFQSVEDSPPGGQE